MLITQNTRASGELSVSSSLRLAVEDLYENDDDKIRY